MLNPFAQAAGDPVGTLPEMVTALEVNCTDGSRFGAAPFFLCRDFPFVFPFAFPFANLVRAVAGGSAAEREPVSVLQ